MNKLIFTSLSLACFLALSACSSNTSGNQEEKTSAKVPQVKPIVTKKENLKNTISKYKDCSLQKDVRCIFNLTDEQFTQQNGLTYEVVKELYKTVDISKFENTYLSEISKENGKLSATASFDVDFSMAGENTNKIEKYNMVSYDDGQTWFFVPIVE